MDRKGGGQEKGVARVEEVGREMGKKVGCKG